MHNATSLVNNLVDTSHFAGRPSDPRGLYEFWLPEGRLINDRHHLAIGLTGILNALDAFERAPNFACEALTMMRESSLPGEGRDVHAVPVLIREARHDLSASLRLCPNQDVGVEARAAVAAQGCVRAH